MGTAAWALWFVEYTWWQMVDQVFYSFSVMFYSLPSLSLCLFINLYQLVHFIICWSEFFCPPCIILNYLSPSWSHSIFLPHHQYFHILSLLCAMSALSSSFSSARRSVGCRRSRTEPEEIWRTRSSEYSSSRSDTHTQDVSLAHIHTHAALISLSRKPLQTYSDSLASR